MIILKKDFMPFFLSVHSNFRVLLHKKLPRLFWILKGSKGQLFNLQGSRKIWPLSVTVCSWAVTRFSLRQMSLPSHRNNEGTIRAVDWSL